MNAEKTGKVPETTKKAEVSAYDAGDFAVDLLSGEDIALPSLQLVQAMSESVIESKTVPGTVVDNLTNQVKSDKDGRITIYPFHFTKFWYRFTKVKNDLEFKDVEPIITAAQLKSPLEETIDGEQIVRQYALRLAVMLANESMPYFMHFRSSGLPTAKTLITEMYIRNAADNRPPYYTGFHLQIGTKTGPKGPWYVYKMAGRTEPTPEAIQERMKTWIKRINQ